MTLCECGCGKEAKTGNKFIQGHNSRLHVNNEFKINNTLRNNLSPWNKGNSDYIRGEKNPFYGKHHTEDSNNKNRDAHLGKKASQETKDKMSKAQGGKNNHMYGKVTNRWSYGDYYNSPLQGEIYLRSSYEIAYAKWLDSNKILWYYEIEAFDIGDTTYTPDFFLIKENKFIEIKGYMTTKAQQKIDMFLEQYPWNLEILRKENLIKLGIDIK